MKITDLKCAVIGGQPTIRIATDEGLSGYGAVEQSKASYIRPHVEFYKQYLLDQDPRDVERVMTRIRRMASFKPWGSAVSGIEVALWDLAGKSAGLPVYRLMGGKVRDRVRAYHTVYSHLRSGNGPEAYAEATERTLARPEGFTILKQAVGFHSTMSSQIEGYFYGDPRTGPPHPNSGPLTQAGMEHTLACVDAIVEASKGRAGVALDCGPGWMLADAIRFARKLEKHHILWIEDILTGDYVPWVNPEEYRELTQSTTTPTHTGEQIYLRQNFRQLIESHAVRVVGPDPLDIGGLAELKWVAEYADLHGIMMAPHGIGNGLIGLAGVVQVCATMPDNLVAFECPSPSTEWWPEIVDGMENIEVKDGHVVVADAPGIGIDLIPERARKYLEDEDKDFFD